MAAQNSSTLTVTTPTEREILMTRVFDAPRKLLFAAWTDPKYVAQWLLGPEGWTMPVCEIDLRPGGAWRFVWRKSDGAEMEMTGVYREVKPPERVVHTERWGAEWPETINTLTFTEKDGKTTCSLTVLYVSQEARDAALKTGMEDGVAVSFDRLAVLLGSMS
jgi:uncharacterized protein YndB with AHSA1/START domain